MKFILANILVLLFFTDLSIAQPETYLSCRVTDRMRDRVYGGKMGVFIKPCTSIVPSANCVSIRYCDTFSSSLNRCRTISSFMSRTRTEYMSEWPLGVHYTANTTEFVAFPKDESENYIALDIDIHKMGTDKDGNVKYRGTLGAALFSSEGKIWPTDKRLLCEVKNDESFPQ